MLNENLNESVNKVFEYIDWFRAYDLAETDDEKRVLIVSYSTEVSTLLLETKTKVETLFDETIDQPIYLTEDYLRLRKFLIYWFSAYNTLVKEELNVSDINFIDKPLLLESLGYDLWHEHSELYQDTLATSISDMYAKKGSPLVVAQALSMLDISNFQIFEYWLDRNTYSDLQFIPEVINDTTFNSGFVLDEMAPKPYASVVESDPHWYLTEQEIEQAETDGELGLPSMTPYVGIVASNDWIRQSRLMMAWWNRITTDTYTEFLEDPTTLATYQKYFLALTGSRISLLELHLSIGYVYNELFDRTDGRYARGSVVDLTGEIPSRYNMWPNISQYDNLNLYSFIKKDDGTILNIPYKINETDKEISFYTDVKIDGEIVLMGQSVDNNPSNFYTLNLEPSDWVLDENTGRYFIEILPYKHGFVNDNYLVYLIQSDGYADRVTDIRINETYGEIYVYRDDPLSGKLIVFGQLPTDEHQNIYAKNFTESDFITPFGEYIIPIPQDEHNFTGYIIPQAYDSDGNLLYDVEFKLFSSNYQYENNITYQGVVNPNVVDVKVCEDGNQIILITDQAPYLETFRWVPHLNTYKPNNTINFTFTSTPTKIDVSEDGKFLAVGHDDGQRLVAFRWDRYLLRYGKTANLEPLEEPGGTIRDIAMSYDGRKISVVHDNDRQVSSYEWDKNADQYRVVELLDPSEVPTGQVRNVALTGNGFKLIVTHDDGNKITTYLWNNELNQYQKTNDITSGEEYSGTSLDIAVSEFGEYLVVLSDSGDYVTSYKWVEGKYIKTNGYNSVITGTPQNISLSSNGLFLTVNTDSNEMIFNYKLDESDDTYKKLFPLNVLPNEDIVNLDMGLDGKLLVTAQNEIDGKLKIYFRNDINGVTMKSLAPFNGRLVIIGDTDKTDSFRFLSGRINNMGMVPHFNGDENILYDETLYVSEYNKTFRRTFDRDEKDQLLLDAEEKWHTYGPIVGWTHNEIRVALGNVNPDLKDLVDHALESGTAYDVLIDLLNVLDFYVRHDLGLTSFSSLYMLFDPIQQNKEAIENVFNFFKPYQTRLIEIASYLVIKDIPGDCMAAKDGIYDSIRELIVDFCIYHKTKINAKIKQKNLDRYHFNKQGFLPPGIIPQGPSMFLIDRLSFDDTFKDSYQEDFNDDVKRTFKQFYVHFYLRYKDDLGLKGMFDFTDRISFNRDLSIVGVPLFELIHSNIKEGILDRYTILDKFESSKDQFKDQYEEHYDYSDTARNFIVERPKDYIFMIDDENFKLKSWLRDTFDFRDEIVKTSSQEKLKEIVLIYDINHMKIDEELEEVFNYGDQEKITPKMYFDETLDTLHDSITPENYDMGIIIEEEDWDDFGDHFEAVISNHGYTTDDLILFGLQSDFSLFDLTYTIDKDSYDITIKSSVRETLCTVLISPEDGYKVFKKEIREELWSRIDEKYIVRVEADEHDLEVNDIFVHLKNFYGSNIYQAKITIENDGAILIETNDKFEGVLISLGKDKNVAMNKIYGIDVELSDWVYDPIEEDYHIDILSSEHSYTNSVVFPFIRDSDGSFIDIKLIVKSLRRDNKVSFYTNIPIAGRLNVFNFVNIPWSNI